MARQLLFGGMATKSERVHAEEQKHGPTPKAKKRAKARKTRADKLSAPHENVHAGKKASYAREEPAADGRKSRKSSRSSANRSKPDTNLTLREQRAKSSPEARFRQAKARASRVRGSKGSAAP